MTQEEKKEMVSREEAEAAAVWSADDEEIDAQLEELLKEDTPNKKKKK